ncbi:MAG: glycoside hydrolase family 27 protein [Draconibacterium sp.]|nr:glycoside hydrolase family 27 protein [Draconibacterium sp.]
MQIKTKIISLIFVLTLAVLNVYSQQTPPMGWNSWNKFATRVTEDIIKETADAMKFHKLDEAGYKYIVIDDTWQEKTLGYDGLLQASKEKFPGGIKALTEYVNNLGFELGIYSCPNTLTCANFPGSLGLEDRHAKQFADWGIKFLKYDYCPTRNKEQRNTQGTILDRYIKMKSALDKVDSTIIFAICEKGWYSGNIKWAKGYREQTPVTAENRSEMFSWAPELGTMWRTTNDINAKWETIMKILDEQEGLAELAGPGAFNDPDMLEVGNGNLTLAENRAHFSLWCILAAPLFLGNDIAAMNEEILEIITNEELIALNQDPLCKQAEKVYDKNGIEIFLKPLANGDFGVCILNRNENTEKFNLKWEYLGINENEKLSIQDLWENKKLKKSKKNLETTINSHDVKVFRIGKVN